MSSFVRKNIRTILLFAFFFIILIIFHIENFMSTNKKYVISSEFEFDSLKEKDIIPFDSVLNGDFSMYVEFAYDLNNYSYFESSDIIKFNHNNVYFCKDENCLKNEKYDYVDNLYSVGNTTRYSYHVPSYNEVFNENNTKYNAWELYFLEYYYYAKNSHTHYIGTFYDILLIPTDRKKNSCITDNEINYGIDKGYEILSNDSWVKNEKTYSLNRNTDGKLKIGINAKKGDKVFFDLKTTSKTLKIYLNENDVTNSLKITDSSYKYNNKMLTITKDGYNVLKFEDSVIKSKNYSRFNSFVNVKDIVVFSDSDKYDANTYYVNCGSDRLVGSSDSL